MAIVPLIVINRIYFDPGELVKMFTAKEATDIGLEICDKIFIYFCSQIDSISQCEIINKQRVLLQWYLGCYSRLATSELRSCTSLKITEVIITISKTTKNAFTQMYDRGFQLETEEMDQIHPQILIDVVHKLVNTIMFMISEQISTAPAIKLELECWDIAVTAIELLEQATTSMKNWSIPSSETTKIMIELAGKWK